MSEKLLRFGIVGIGGRPMAFLSAFEKSFKLNLIINLLLSFTSCAVFAISDELIQNFSAGRAPSIIDVLIDSCGSLVGVLFFFAFYQFYNKFLFPKYISRRK